MAQREGLHSIADECVVLVMRFAQAKDLVTWRESSQRFKGVAASDSVLIGHPGAQGTSKGLSVLVGRDYHENLLPGVVRFPIDGFRCRSKVFGKAWKSLWLSVDEARPSSPPGTPPGSPRSPGSPSLDSTLSSPALEQVTLNQISVQLFEIIATHAVNLEVRRPVY